MGSVRKAEVVFDYCWAAGRQLVVRDTSLPQMRRGPLYMMLATLAFAVMLSLVKVARTELSAFEVVCWRGTTSVSLTFLLAMRGGFGVSRPGMLLARVLLGFGAVGCFFTAAKGLHLADMIVLTKLQPILVALLAPIVLGAGERGGWILGLAVALGLTGTVVLLGPDLAVGSVFGLWAVAGTGFSAGAHVALRAVGSENRPEAIVFWFQLGAVLLSVTVLVATKGGVPLPPAHLWPYLLGCGVATTLGQVLMTRAYSVDPAPLVAAASYVAPVWGVAGDLLLFGEWPSGYVLLGGSLVVVAGVLLLTDKTGAIREAERAQTRL